MNTYGGSNWQGFKSRILARDGWKCLMPGCETPRLGVTVHHLRSVGAGGRNTEENAACLCAFHHEAVHRGGIERRVVQEALEERYAYAAQADGSDHPGADGFDAAAGEGSPARANRRSDV